VQGERDAQRFEAYNSCLPRSGASFPGVLVPVSLVLVSCDLADLSREERKSAQPMFDRPLDEGYVSRYSVSVLELPPKRPGEMRQTRFSERSICFIGVPIREVCNKIAHF